MGMENAVWSGSTLYAQTSLSKYLGLAQADQSLRCQHEESLGP